MQVTLQETKRMAEDAKRMRQDAQEQVKQAGQAYQNAVESGFEAATRSFSEVSRGFQAIAAEVTDFSKRRIDEVMHARDQLIRARTFGDMVEVQSKYAQKAVDAYTAEWSKIGELYLAAARNATKPLDPSKG